MNIYSKKQRWKVVLFLIAAIIIGLSLVYTNMLVNKLSDEEKRKARLWAESIEEKAGFVAYTQNLFNKVEEEERKFVRLWAIASKSLSMTGDDCDLSLILEVLKNNKTIPVVLADAQLKPVSSKNVENVFTSYYPVANGDSLKLTQVINGEDSTFTILNHSLARDSIKQLNKITEAAEIQLMKEQNEPIRFNISSKETNYNYLFYKNSRRFAELKTAREDLMNSFTTDIIQNSANIPVVYIDSASGQVIETGNLKDSYSEQQGNRDTIIYMETDQEPIRVEIAKGDVRFIYYKESFLLTQLRLYPYVQFGIIGLFLLVAYLLFSTARKAEQNQVWVGMAKETAHQLGTPLSSLIAWKELLQFKNIDKETIDEIDKDLKRLQTITDRFSKIGSSPDLQPVHVKTLIEGSVNYLKPRISDRVKIEVRSTGDYEAMINVPLFEWVIENLTKNAVDAMNGEGRIDFSIMKEKGEVTIDISDTGKGIPRSKFKTIFQPGYTSKKRGWGLGLTLVKRIIHNYHSGKIFVKSSDSTNGTVFRIQLKTA